MTRPIAYTLLDRAAKTGEGEKFRDTETFTVVSLQAVFTARRFSVAIRGRMLGSPAADTIETIDAVACKSGRIVTIAQWPVGIEEVWADVTAIDGGDVTLYFCGRD